MTTSGKTILICSTQGCEREKAREGKCLHHHIEELNEKIMNKSIIIERFMRCFNGGTNPVLCDKCLEIGQEEMNK